MKTNNTKVLAVLGIVVFALAFFAGANIKRAYAACEYNSNYSEFVCDYDTNTSGSVNVNVENDVSVSNTNVNRNNNSNTVIINGSIDEDRFPAITANCTGSPSRVEVGEIVTWQAHATGGNGYFSYTWSGTESLSSNYPTITKRYNTPGTKTATVRITSNFETVTRTCTVVVEEEVVYNLSVNCVASPSSVDIGETVRYTANVSGGQTSPDYSWSGTNGLSGTSRIVTKSYNTEGTKSATVTIRSGSQTRTATCNVRVDEEERREERRNDDLDASCKGTPDDAQVGDRIRWTVDVDGGDGDYEYEWDGDDNLRGDDRSISKTYSTSGRKDAKVEVESNGDRVTARCSVDIERDREVRQPEVIYTPDLPPPTGGIYLSSIPATGISPTMKVTLFVVGLLMWSAFLGYLYIARRNEKMNEEALLASIAE